MPLPAPKKTKIGTGFYQFSYGQMGWVSAWRHHTTGLWRYSAHRYTKFETFEAEGKSVTLGMGKPEQVAEELGYKTMTEAVEDGRRKLLPFDEREALESAERAALHAEVQANIARLTAIYGPL